MEFKAKRTKENRNAGSVPPPDRSRRRKKAHQKVGKGPIAGKRYASLFRTLGKLGSFLLLVSFISAIFFYAYTSEKFNLGNVRFYGCKEVDTVHLENIIRTDFPANILRIDLKELKSRLEKETWVKRVEIRRVLPSGLLIYVHERIPSVILEMKNELMVADQDGILLGQYAPKFGKLDVPVFRGILGEDAKSYRLYQDTNSERIRRGLSMLSEIEAGLPQSTKRISEVDISDPKNLKIMLVDDTAEVYLGGKDYLERFTTFMKNQDKYETLKSQYKEIASVDLRYEDQIVYRPRYAEDGKKVKDMNPKR